MCSWTRKTLSETISTAQSSIRLSNIKKSVIQHLLVNLFVHLKVSKVFVIVFKNCLFAFCDTSRDEHHLKVSKHICLSPSFGPHLGLILHLLPFSFCLRFPKAENQTLGDTSSMIPHLDGKFFTELYIEILSHQGLHLSESQSRERSHLSPWWHPCLNLNRMHNLCIILEIDNKTRMMVKD